MCELLDQLAGPALLARTTVTSPARIRETKRLMKKALRYQMDGTGFSLVEVLSPCPTYWRMSPIECFRHIEEVLTRVFPLGVIRDAKAENHE
jgi:2-oxoglutarate ferredoxin oxidoreductase subunit beta